MHKLSFSGIESISGSLFFDGEADLQEWDIDGIDWKVAEGITTATIRISSDQVLNELQVAASSVVHTKEREWEE